MAVKPSQVCNRPIRGLPGGQAVGHKTVPEATEEPHDGQLPWEGGKRGGKIGNSRDEQDLFKANSHIGM